MNRELQGTNLGDSTLRWSGVTGAAAAFERSMFLLVTLIKGKPLLHQIGHWYICFLGLAGVRRRERRVSIGRWSHNISARAFHFSI